MFKKIIIALLCLSAAVTVVFASGIIVTDRSAVYSAEGLKWNGAFYKPCSGFFDEGKTVAKTSDGNWNINAVNGDSNRDFVVVRSFTDESLLVRSDYEIPESGNPAAVYLRTNRIDDPVIKNIFSDIFLNEGENFSLTAALDDVNKWQSVYIGYEECPVAIFRGYLGFADGKYFFTVDLSGLTEKDDSNGGQFTVICKTVDESHYAVLDGFFM